MCFELRLLGPSSCVLHREKTKVNHLTTLNKFSQRLWGILAISHYRSKPHVSPLGVEIATRTSTCRHKYETHRTRQIIRRQSAVRVLLSTHPTRLVPPPSLTVRNHQSSSAVDLAWMPLPPKLPSNSCTAPIFYRQLIY